MGQSFDPHLHEAVASQPADGVASGTVIDVYQAGYRLGDDVLRAHRARHGARRGERLSGAERRQRERNDPEERDRCHISRDVCRNGNEQTRRHRAEHDEAYLVRELFVPRSGLLAAPDAKQIELRVFAHLSGSDRLAKIYADNPDTDFHAVVGDMVAAYRPDVPCSVPVIA